jgi:hypothetical protein
MPAEFPAYLPRSRALQGPGSGSDGLASSRSEVDAVLGAADQSKLADVVNTLPAHQFLGINNDAICSNESSDRRRVVIPVSGFAAVARNDMEPKGIGLAEQGNAHSELC